MNPTVGTKRLEVVLRPINDADGQPPASNNVADYAVRLQTPNGVVNINDFTVTDGVIRFFVDMAEHGTYRASVLIRTAGGGEYPTTDLMWYTERSMFEEVAG